MKIKFYIKADKRAKSPRRVVRAEVQMRGRPLRKKLNDGAQIHALVLMDCYAAYRATLRKFGRKKTVKFNSKDEALFYAETKGVRVVERLAKTMHARSISRLREKFGKYLLEHYKIDWETLLPKNSLPPKFDAGELRCPVRIRFVKPKLKIRVKNRTRKSF